MDIFGPARDTVLTMEFRGTVLRAALVQIQKNPVILACESCPIDSGFSEAAGRLRFLIQKAGKRLLAKVLILSREEIILRQAMVSAPSPEAEGESIREKVYQLIPFESTEVVHDFKILEKKDDEYVVRFAAGHRRIVDEKFKLLEEVPLVPDRVVFSGEAILAACREKNLRWVGPTGVLLMDVDLESSEIIFVNQSQLVYSKKIEVGREALEAKDPVAFSKFFHELDVFLQDTQEKIKDVAKRVVISGKLPAGQVLEAKIKEYFWMDPQILEIQGQESVDFSITTLLGGAFAAISKFYDLLPETIKRDKNHEERNEAISQVFRAISGLMMAVLFLALAHWGARQWVLSSLESKVKELKPRVVSLEETAVGLRLRSEHENVKWAPLEIVAKLHEATPAGVVLKKLSYERGKGMVLNGTASANQAIPQYFNQIRALAGVQQAALDFSQMRKGREEEGSFEFQIRFLLKGADDARS